MNITPGLSYQQLLLNDKNVHVIRYNQEEGDQLTLLISKVSEAILPDTEWNHIGEGDKMDNFLLKQKDVRFIINGGFNHYRKDFYQWSHQNFNIGDPVGVVKIRNHIFQDFIEIDSYGFLVQEEKKLPWKIKKIEDVTLKEKYVLGCTPLLIYEGAVLPLPEMASLEAGIINPPSVLAHGVECHPRTAVGTKDDELYFLLVEGDNGKDTGCTLLQLQQIGQSLKLDYFLNLDGGGSSQFRLFNGKKWIQNYVHEEDKNRKLGHVLVIFDKALEE